MNHLVHLYLSDPSDGCLLGALMGDYVKGRLELDNRYPQDIRRGLRLHRSIDSFAETNRHFQSSKRRFDSRLRHCRGILVDVAYDHLLALHWADFDSAPLEEFATSIYRLLERHHAVLPPGLQDAAPRMIAADWLVACRHEETVERVLRRLSLRLSRPNGLGHALLEIERHRPHLEVDFRHFIADARRHIEFLGDKPGTTARARG